MTAWWQDLSGRERVMILVAGGLAGVLVLSLGVIRPLADWRASAAREAQMARDGFELTATAAAIAGGADAGSNQAQVPLRDALIRTANASGIQIVRLGADTGNALDVQIEPVNGDVLFAWLADLENRYGVTVAAADLSRGKDGIVTPQMLTFTRR